MTSEQNQTEALPEVTKVTNELLDTWATDPKGPVALYLKQKLLPVEGEGGIIFPPTYADIGYNIDTLSDGTRVATIDSVGSQANRMEPIFKASAEGQNKNPLAKLVPQIEIVLHAGKKDENPHREKRSILDLAHRSADAVVQSSPQLSTAVAEAFEALRRTGDSGPLCILAPTSLVFGVWDSRGGTGEKRPRLVRAIIRAWDVEPLHAAAQFSSVWKALDESQRAELEKEAKSKKTKLSEKGLADAPATF
jgi:CRISPR-associated protein Csb1